MKKIVLAILVLSMSAFAQRGSGSHFTGAVAAEGCVSVSGSAPSAAVGYEHYIITSCSSRTQSVTLAGSGKAGEANLFLQPGEMVETSINNYRAATRVKWWTCVSSAQYARIPWDRNAKSTPYYDSKSENVVCKDN